MVSSFITLRGRHRNIFYYFHVGAGLSESGPLPKVVLIFSVPIFFDLFALPRFLKIVPFDESASFDGGESGCKRFAISASSNLVSTLTTSASSASFAEPTFPKIVRLK